MREIKAKIETLYRVTNQVACHTGAHGEISARHSLFDDLMNALHDLDQGQINLDWLDDLIERKG